VSDVDPNAPEWPIGSLCELCAKGSSGCDEGPRQRCNGFFPDLHKTHCLMRNNERGVLDCPGFKPRAERGVTKTKVKPLLPDESPLRTVGIGLHPEWKKKVKPE